MAISTTNRAYSTIEAPLSSAIHVVALTQNRDTMPPWSLVVSPSRDGTHTSAARQ